MKSQSWNSFTPASSAVINFQGGVRGYDNLYAGLNQERSDWTNDTCKSTSSIFGAISYELRVSAIHSGWHHGVMFQTASGGRVFTNGIVKRACHPGVYQMFLHFKSVNPSMGPMKDVNLNFNIDLNVATFLKMLHGVKYPQETYRPDMMVARPYLMDPTNVNNQFNLWSATAYTNNHGNTTNNQLSGFPINMPHVVNPY